MLSHIDLSPSDILLAFSLAMLLQRIQRRRQRDARDQQQAQRAQHAHEPPAEGEPQNGAAGAGPGHAPSGHGGGSRAGIEMSPQGSPEPAASVCSIEELLSLRAAGSDLEAAWPSALGGLAGNGGRAALRPSLSARPLLSKRYGAAGSSSQGGGAGGGRGGPPNVDRLSGTASFVPAHPSDEEDGNLQLGAEKTGEGPPGREPREPGAAPPHQPVDAGGCAHGWARAHTSASVCSCACAVLGVVVPALVGGAGSSCFCRDPSVAGTGGRPPAASGGVARAAAEPSLLCPGAACRDTGGGGGGHEVCVCQLRHAPVHLQQARVSARGPSHGAAKSGR